MNLTAALVAPRRVFHAYSEGATALRALAASFVGTVLDGAVYQAMLAILPDTFSRGRYWMGALLGAAAGALVHFVINRRWVFHTGREPWGREGARYALGSAITLLVLQGFLFMSIHGLGLEPRVAWLPAKVLTFVAFSYPFQRLVVFTGAAR